jgi:hypothetical protein
VSASDAGEPPLTATTTVYVNVKDVNDNPPDIEKTLYQINIPENVDVGTSILHIHVTDKDSGNGRASTKTPPPDGVGADVAETDVGETYMTTAPCGAVHDFLLKSAPPHAWERIKFMSVTSVRR